MRQIIAEYHYLTIEETIRRNGHRHNSKGLWWTEQGYDDRARGSFAKAKREYEKADSFKLDTLMESIFKPIIDQMAKMTANNIINGSTIK